MHQCSVFGPRKLFYTTVFSYIFVFLCTIKCVYPKFFLLLYFYMLLFLLFLFFYVYKSFYSSNFFLLNLYISIISIQHTLETPSCKKNKELYTLYTCETTALTLRWPARKKRKKPYYSFYTPPHPMKKTPHECALG